MEVSFSARLLWKSEIPADHLSATTTYRRDHLIAEVLEAWTREVLKGLGARVHSRVEMREFQTFMGRRRVASPFRCAPPRGRLMTTRKTLLVLCCTLLFSVCPLLYGQATGSFSGTVTDKTGSVVSGANVKATAQATGGVRESKTDDSGH